MLINDHERLGCIIHLFKISQLIIHWGQTAPGPRGPREGPAELRDKYTHWGQTSPGPRGTGEGPAHLRDKYTDWGQTAPGPRGRGEGPAALRDKYILTEDRLHQGLEAQEKAQQR